MGLILEHEKEVDGGLNPAATIRHSDVCVKGMFLNYATYFEAEEEQLHSIADFILSFPPVANSRATPVAAPLPNPLHECRIQRLRSAGSLPAA